MLVYSFRGFTDVGIEHHCAVRISSDLLLLKFTLEMLCKSKKEHPLGNSYDNQDPLKLANGLAPTGVLKLRNMRYSPVAVYIMETPSTKEKHQLKSCSSLKIEPYICHFIVERSKCS